MYEHEMIAHPTRAQALAAGLLIDVTEAARPLGYRLPIAVTAALWDDISNIPPALQGINSVDGRLWDVLWCGRLAIERQRIPANHPTALIYELILPLSLARLYTIKLVIGPDDDEGLVITLMRDDEY